MSHLPVIDRTYDFAVWLQGQIRRFPRDQRFGFGQRLEAHALEVLETLVEARYATKRQPTPGHANRRLQSLRCLVRMAHELKLFDDRRYARAATALEDVGRQWGAWVRAAAGASGAPAMRRAGELPRGPVGTAPARRP